ncbi:hypothetical protein Tco_0402054 [Tanacetum coccineum]
MRECEEDVFTANQQFLDSIDDGMKKIIKEQVKKEVSKIIPKVEKLVIDQLESEVLMETNNSINRSDIQRQLYKDLVEAYEADKILLDTYGDTVTIKRPRDGADDDEEPSAGTDRGSKRRRSGTEPASTSAPSETTTKTAGQTTDTDVSERPADQEFETGVQDEQAEEEVQHLPDWFQKPTRLPSPDHAWNTSVPAVHESVQPWLSNLAQQDPRESFDELTDSTFDFSAFVLNRLNVQTLTPELLAGPTFELMKGTCKSLTELEYFCEEVYKATTEKLDWINPEGRQYPHDLRHSLTRKYSTSVTKTKAADYGHIKWIEDLVPNSMWSQTIVKYDKFALWGISHWGKKRRQFYAFATLRESARDVYSKRRIIVVTKVEIKLNSPRPDTYRQIGEDKTLILLLRSRGLIYENKTRRNRVMRIDELHKFSDGTLDDVRTALNDRSIGYKIGVTCQTFWKPSRTNQNAVSYDSRRLTRKA